MARICAVIFDLDNVLYDERDYICAAFRSIALFLSERCRFSEDEIYSKLVCDFEKKGSMYPRLFNDAVDDLGLNQNLGSGNFEAVCHGEFQDRAFSGDNKHAFGASASWIETGSWLPTAVFGFNATKSVCLELRSFLMPSSMLVKRPPPRRSPILKSITWLCRNLVWGLGKRFVLVIIRILIFGALNSWACRRFVFFAESLKMSI